MSILSKLRPPPGAKRSRTRVGRGVGSGLGKTCGRGSKGQKARCGHGKPHFEGGQMPLQRRLPKRGFFNIHSDEVANVNVGSLDVFDNGAEVTVESLRQHKLVKGRHDILKVLGAGDLKKKLTIHAHAFSASAIEKIEKAGGKAVIIPRRQPKEPSPS